MSVKTEMMRAVMNVIALRKGLTNLEDNDIAFIEAAGNYGASIDKDNAAFGMRELSAAQIKITHEDLPSQGATGPTSLPPAAQLPDSVGPGPDDEGQGALELDRGPEPQTISETLDNTPPAPADAAQAQDDARVAANAPDYTLLSNRKG